MSKITIQFELENDLSDDERKSLKEQIARVVVGALAGNLKRTGISLEQTSTEKKKIKGNSSINF